MEDILSKIKEITKITRYGSTSGVIIPAKEVEDTVNLVWKRLKDKVTPETQILDMRVNGGSYLLLLADKLINCPQLSHLDYDTRKSWILDHMLFGIALHETDAAIARKSLYDDATIKGNIITRDEVDDLRNKESILKAFDGKLKSPMAINTREVPNGFKGFYGSGDFIIIRVGESYTTQRYALTADETVEVFIRDLEVKNFVWYPFISPNKTISADKVNEYNNRINAGYEVRLLFVIDSEIRYSAKILEVNCPEELRTSAYYPECPIEYHNQATHVWIKITDLKVEDTLKAEELIITSSGKNMKSSIVNGQFTMSYASYKD